MEKLKPQIKRVFVHFIHLLQNILGDDIVSIKVRLFLLSLLGNQFGHNTKILNGCTVLGGKLRTGSNVFINRNCYFDLSGSVLIEDNVGIGHGVTFITASHILGPPENRAGHVVKGLISGKDIHIKKGAWIAANATLQPGITVGEGAVVLTGSVVSKDVAPNTLVGGIPAKVLKTLDDA